MKKPMTTLGLALSSAGYNCTALVAHTVRYPLLNLTPLVYNFLTKEQIWALHIACSTNHRITCFEERYSVFTNTAQRLARQLHKIKNIPSSFSRLDSFFSHSRASSKLDFKFLANVDMAS